MAQVDKYNVLTIDQLKKGVDQIMKNLKNPADFKMSILECIETTYAYDKRPQVRLDGDKYYCAIVVKLYQEKLKYGNDYKIKSGFDASHFYCHNEHCVNHEHIHFEDHRVNKSRLCCRIYGMNNGYGCPHLPRCNINELTRIKL